MNAPTTSVVAVDWGTSHLRLWALDGQGKAKACHRSERGMRTVERDEFASVLNAEMQMIEVDADTPVIMCGMVGSRQGWQEAPYNKMPCRIDAIATNAVKIVGVERDIRILPGIAHFNATKPDVMRSEETQLLGLFDMLGQKLSGLICMPGSHAKWVRIENGLVIDFATSMSGELFAALSASSVLQHSLKNVTKKVDPQSNVYSNAVRESLSDPATVLTRLFAARPQSLLNQVSDDDAAAHISGTIIGQDIAGAIARFAPVHATTLVGSGHLGDLYSQALQIAGLQSKMVDGDELAILGLSHAAKLIWPDRFDPVASNNRASV